MSPNRSKQQQRAPRTGWESFASLHGMVRLVLCVDWDPIDLFGTVQTLDEYDQYASGVRQLLERGTSVEELTALLRSFSMCRTVPGRHEATANKLLKMHWSYISNSAPGRLVSTDEE